MRKTDISKHWWKEIEDNIFICKKCNLYKKVNPLNKDRMNHINYSLDNKKWLLTRIDCYTHRVIK